MAVVKIPSDNVTLTDAQDVTTFLAVRGIEYERWTPSRTNCPPMRRPTRSSKPTRTRSRR